MSFGTSVSDKFILVLGSPQIGSLICNGECEKSGRAPSYFKFYFVRIFWREEFLFAHRSFCSGVMNLKDEFCSKLFTLLKLLRLSLFLLIWIGGSSVITCRLYIGEVF